MDHNAGSTSPFSSHASSSDLSPPESELAPSDDETGLEGLADRLSHHLLGLVSSIEGYTDLLADTLGTPEQRELTLRILEGAARIERLVANLRRYSQPVEPVMRLLEVRQLVKELAAVLPDEAWTHIDVDYEVPPAHGLWADPVLLRQALLVLVQNGLEAVSDSPVRLTVSYLDADDATCFSVRNEGAIALDEDESRIFEPFYTTKPSHLGMGLPLARRIAESHEGTLRLESSASDESTCFTLRIPRREVDQADLVLRDQ